MKKLLALFLSSLLLVSSAVSCGGDTPAEDPKTSDTEPSQTTETSDPRLSVDDGLPEKDYEEYEFRILYYDDQGKPNPYVPESMTGDVVDDAIYERNQRVEERFNIDITSINDGLGWYEHGSYVQQLILAGGNDFDISMNHIVGGPNYVLEGSFLNLYDLEYIDFTKPWWSGQMVDEMTVNNQLYLTADVLGMGALKSAKVHFLNLKEFSEYNLELPYQQVLDGTWTFDKLIALTKDVYEDVNGNSQKDTGDFFGYTSHASQNGYLTAFEAPVLVKDDAETLKLGVQSEKMTAIIEKIYSWYFETPGSCIVTGNDPDTGVVQNDWQANLFAQGHSLVGFALLEYATTTFRNSNVEYGIIPFPKWDENQESYRTFCGGDLIGVPVTAEDPERTGIILEALAAETYKTVVPAFFETALKEKFTFDAESGQMLDIVNNTLTISFAYAYDNWEGFGHLCGKLFAGGNPTKDFASYYAGNESSARARLQLIVDFYEENGD